MIFIDAGAFLARYVKRDQFHARAIAHWEHMQQSQERCFTSNLVVSEALTLLARRTAYNFAAERARRIYASQTLQIMRPNAEDEVAALSYFEKYGDQRVSFADCVSFVLMKKHGIERAFSFDHHFQLAGFTIEPPASE